MLAADCICMSNRRKQHYSAKTFTYIIVKEDLELPIKYLIGGKTNGLKYF
jgi:hypothetical protein